MENQVWTVKRMEYLRRNLSQKVRNVKKDMKHIQTAQKKYTK